MADEFLDKRQHELDMDIQKLEEIINRWGWDGVIMNMSSEAFIKASKFWMIGREDG